MLDVSVLPIYQDFGIARNLTATLTNSSDYYDLCNLTNLKYQHCHIWSILKINYTFSLKSNYNLIALIYNTDRDFHNLKNYRYGWY